MRKAAGGGLGEKPCVGISWSPVESMLAGGTVGAGKLRWTQTTLAACREMPRGGRRRQPCVAGCVDCRSPTPDVSDTPGIQRRHLKATLARSAAGCESHGCTTLLSGAPLIGFGRGHPRCIKMQLCSLWQAQVVGSRTVHQ